LLTPFLLLCFLGEIQQQCRYVIRAARQIEADWAAIGRDLHAVTEHVARGSDPSLGELHARDRSYTEGIWYDIQNLVIAAAMISKMLWGTKPPKRCINDKSFSRRMSLRRGATSFLTNHVSAHTVDDLSTFCAHVRGVL
jgi:hypothetical protein